MTDSHTSRRDLVVDEHTVTLQIDTGAAPEMISVEAFVDGQRVRGWEEPGWCEVRIGVAHGRPYWWSARRLVGLPVDADDRLFEVTFDEDIVVVYGLRNGWLVVAESSVRLLRDGDESSRLELRDVVQSSSFDGTSLRLTVGDATTTVSVSVTELEASAGP